MDKDAIIRQQELIIRDQGETIRSQHQELAELRHRAYLVDNDPLGFAIWLVLHEIQPFKCWYQWRYGRNV